PVARASRASQGSPAVRRDDDRPKGSGQPAGCRRDEEVIGLLRTYLRPYMGRITIVLALLLVQAIGNLYLPTLQGDIINDGVAKGNTDFIGSTGVFMLVVTFVVGLASIVGVYFGAQLAMG